MEKKNLKEQMDQTKVISLLVAILAPISAFVTLFVLFVLYLFL